MSEVLESVSAEALQARIDLASGPDVPKLYMNGFLATMTGGDVACVLECNGKPVAMLNMSFTIAKSLSLSLGTVIANLESRSDRVILTANELEKLLAAESEKK